MSVSLFFFLLSVHLRFACSFSLAIHVFLYFSLSSLMVTRWRTGFVYGWTWGGKRLDEHEGATPRCSLVVRGWEDVKREKWCWIERVYTKRHSCSFLYFSSHHVRFPGSGSSQKDPFRRHARGSCGCWFDLYFRATVKACFCQVYDGVWRTLAGR
ncbi:hypothetical protein VUR80DRAFT_3773 [Thermomyces stellatus]